MVSSELSHKTLPESHLPELDISALIKQALQEVATEKNLSEEDVHTLRVCGPVTDRIISDLQALGLKAHKERRITWVGKSLDESGNPLPITMQEKPAVIHNYAVIKDSHTTDDYIIDATWQQFLTPEQRTVPGLPVALIGTRAKVVVELETNGFNDPELQKIWMARDTFDQPVVH